jgi:EAL domain-containing protein (putative c-di-GMP-specific phosphodiesterase class I)
MNSEEFLDFLRKTLAVTKIPLEKITFEITETVAAGSFKFVQSFIKKIKRFKCKFSLDDFGSGYSSYSYLKSLDVDYLKIDGIFVKDLPNNATDIAIVKSMNEIAHSLNLKTIAEYVENDAILAILKEMGVDYAQGWGIQKPILLNDLKLEEPEALLQEEV